MERKSERDLSRQVWKRKHSGYNQRSRGSLHFVADSHWLATQAKSSGLLRERSISVIHYGVDTDIFRPMDRALARSVFNVPAGLPVLSFAAASIGDERKGMRNLMEAVSGMPSRPFLLTWGRGLPAGFDAIPHLHLGNIDSEHLMALAYNAADAFAMPSLEEAFGQTALEALACGTPVVAFAAGGIPDSVRHEQTGLLVPVGDNEGLRAAITRLLADRHLWNTLSEQGRRMVEAEFTMELNAKRYIELYQTLLANSESAKPGN